MWTERTSVPLDAPKGLRVDLLCFLKVTLWPDDDLPAWDVTAGPP